MKKLISFASAACLFMATTAQAHFGIVIPSDNQVLEKKKATISTQFAFAHPFEGKGMNLDIQKVEVFVDGKSQDITATLKAGKYMGKQGYVTDYKLAKPGVYTIAMTPKPYWEAAEDKFIIHYTKTVVAGFGSEEGWAEPVGLPVEIVPLVRPFAAYAPNSFRGLVLKDGKPVANTEVEFEYLNGTAGTYKAPTDYFVTQVVRTDANGVFTATVPFEGWWGFAALVDGDSKIKQEGQDKDVELGGVLWVRFANPVKARK